MLTKSERLVCSILGTTRSDIRPLSAALDAILSLHFAQNIPRGNIKVTKSVYPQIACQLNKSPSAVSRSVERLANLCWETARKQGRLPELVGRELLDIPATSDVLFYLAYLLYFNKPFFTVLDDLDRLDRLTPSA